MKKQSYVIIASAVLVVSLATTGIASAASSAGSFVKTSLFSGNHEGRLAPSIIGKITAINGTTLTITNRKGVAYTVDASAVQNLSTVSLGDTIAVVGSISGTTVTANAISERPSRENRIVGKITEVSGSTLHIETMMHHRSAATEEYSITLPLGVVITKNGVADSSSSLTAGTLVSITGEIDHTTKTGTATNINIINPIPFARIVGTVKTISGTTLTIALRDGTTRNVDASTATIVTQRRQQHGQSSSLSKVSVGDKIHVIGAPTTSPEETIVATIIQDIH